MFESKELIADPDPQNFGEIQTENIQGIAEKDRLLNGAQVRSIIDVTIQFKQGVLDKDSARQILISAFGLDAETADKILGDQDPEKILEILGKPKSFNQNG